MVASNPNFPGAIAGAEANLTEERALFLKMFAGEILGFYNDYNVLGQTIMRKEITTGK